MPGIIRRAVRRLREARVADSCCPEAPGKLGWRTPADPGRRTRTVARGHDHGRTRCTGPDSDGRLAVLFDGPHHCEPSFRQGRCAARRPAVPDRRVRRGPVCARPDARPADHPVGEDRALLQETLAQHGPWRSWPRPAPSRSSLASREPISRSTARGRRDLAAPDLPAEAGRAGPSRQRRRPPPPLDRRAGHLPAGRILRSRFASHPGRTARRADSPVPGTQAPGHTRRHRTLF